VGTFEQRRRSMAIGETRAHHEALGLDEDDLRRLYYHMLLARRVDERSWILNRQGKAAFVISCQGQEAPRSALPTTFALATTTSIPTTAIPA
jgi:2-oxoisovalerate dehydrogenase E1 component alpha subunit